MPVTSRRRPWACTRPRVAEGPSGQPPGLTAGQARAGTTGWLLTVPAPWPGRWRRRPGQGGVGQVTRVAPVLCGRGAVRPRGIRGEQEPSAGSTHPRPLRADLSSARPGSVLVQPRPCPGPMCGAHGASPGHRGAWWETPPAPPCPPRPSFRPSVTAPLSFLEWTLRLWDPGPGPGWRQPLPHPRTRPVAPRAEAPSGWRTWGGHSRSPRTPGCTPGGGARGRGPDAGLEEGEASPGCSGGPAAPPRAGRGGGSRWAAPQPAPPGLLRCPFPPSVGAASTTSALSAPPAFGFGALTAGTQGPDPHRGPSRGQARRAAEPPCSEGCRPRDAAGSDENGGGKPGPRTHGLF